jgi:hypothetical protein
MINGSPDSTPKPSRLPIVLSAFTFPGAGQMVQRRWGPALFFSVAFLSAFAVFMVHAASIIAAFYRLGVQFETYEQQPIPVLPAAIAFLFSMLIYVLGLLDTHRAYRRDCLKWAHRRLRPPPFSY